MKKERILKYLILICGMIMSFFIFISGEVSALEYSVNDGKIILELEQEDPTDITKGYAITGASVIEGVESIQNWVIPDSYIDGEENVYPIVGIKDGLGNLSGGVLKALSGIVSGNVVLGKNIEYIGLCAFCDFEKVTQYELNDKLVNVGEYAFANNISLQNVVVKAYNNGIRTVLANENVFNSSISLKRLVFKNATIASTYRSSDVWSAFGNTEKYPKVSFTYKINYRFYNEVDKQTINKTVDFYYGESLANVPSDISKKGLTFSWVSANNGKQITPSSTAIEFGQVDEFTSIPVHDIIPKWELKGTDKLYIKTLFNGEEKNHEESSKSISLTYFGKSKQLTISAMVEHEFINKTTGNLEENFAIDYSWVKVGSYGMESDVIGTDSITLFRVGDSGTYKCKITMRYVGYETVIEYVDIKVDIIKRNITINVKNYETEYGTYVESVEDTQGTYFEVDQLTPFMDNESIKVFGFNGYCKEINESCEKSEVSSIKDVLTGTVLNVGYQGDETNFVDNYNFEYVKGDLTISPKKINHSLNQDIEVFYGESENLVETVNNVLVYGEQISIKVKYVREDESNVDVGRYSVLSASVVNNGVVDNNYEIKLSNVNVGQVVIKPKKVSVIWLVDGQTVYDSTEKIVSASYKDINNQLNELSVQIKKNGQDSIIKNAGEYNLIASMIDEDKNYELANHKYNLTIKKADSVLIGAQTQSVTYNGKPQRVNLSLNHNEGVISYGDYSNCKNAGVSSSSFCEVSVSVEETENYNGIDEKIYYLRILRYRLEVAPKVFERTYGTVVGDFKLCDSYIGVNEENLNICFSVKDVSSITAILPVGYYDIQSAYTNDSLNYDIKLVSETGKEKIKINPAPVVVRFHFYEGLVYDGKVKDIRVKYEGTEEDVGLVVDYGDKKIIKNAGNYRIDARVTNENYYIDGSSYIEFNVAKAKYDISGLKLDDKEVKFNFNSHFINLEGELPEGVQAVYTIDGQKGNGTYLPFKHTVKVSFIGDYENYEYIDPLVATLNLDMGWVWFTLCSIVLFCICVPIAIYFLIKYKIIRFDYFIRRHRVRRVIKKNRELDKLNEMFRNKQTAWYSSQNENEEEIDIIEEPIKFVKKPVNVQPENLIALSFVDELFKSSYGTKQFYSEVKNELLSYEGIVSKIKRDYETFYLNNMPVAKLDVVDGVLYTYFALDPSQYKKDEYHHENVSKEKDFTVVPLKLTVNSIESLRHAKMFVRIIRKKEGIKAVSNFIRTDYVSVYTAKENTMSLFKKAFVKKGTKEYFED